MGFCTRQEGDGCWTCTLQRQLHVHSACSVRSPRNASSSVCGTLLHSLSSEPLHIQFPLLPTTNSTPLGLTCTPAGSSFVGKSPLPNPVSLCSVPPRSAHPPPGSLLFRLPLVEHTILEERKSFWVTSMSLVTKPGHLTDG